MIMRKAIIFFAAAAVLLGTGRAEAQVVSRRTAEMASLQARGDSLQKKVDSLTALLGESREAAAQAEAQAEELRKELGSRQPVREFEPFNLGPGKRDSISLWDAEATIEKAAKEPVYDMDSVKFSSKISDDVYLERLKNMNNIFTLPYNDIVKNYVILWAEKRKAYMPAMLGLCSYYFPIFQETFNRYGIPEEIACLAMVESALNTRAVSRSGARGMWQFMYATGKAYGLIIDSYVDERLDVYKAADAAARYMVDAYRRFGDWSLALSSYNCGGGNITRAIARAGGKTDYWDIYPFLPKETRGYVPSFVGALYITKYYKEHGLNPVPAKMPEKVDTFLIRKKLHFVQVHDLVGIPMEELRNLNPQYVHDIVPGNDREYILRVPEEFVPAFIAAEDSLYKYKVDSLFNPVVIKQIEASSAAYSGMGKIAYKVKSGDTLDKIARKYGVSVANLKKWNNLKSTTIRIGQTLYVYKGGVPAATPAPTTSAKAPSAPASQTAPAASAAAAPAAPAQPQVKETVDTVATPEAEAAPEKEQEATPAEEQDSVAVASAPVDEQDDEDIPEITRHPELDRLEKAAEAAPAVEAEAQAAPEPEYVEYTVQKGDTLFGISQKFDGIKAQEIMDFNGIDANIHPGDVLRIPVKK